VQTQSPSNSARRPPGTDETFTLPHIAPLDGLRGVAILFVILVHLVPSPAPGGWFGVDLFFVLSGFLITSILLREHRLSGGIHLGRFYFRRALRLLPALFLMMLACLAVAYFREPSRTFSYTLLNARAVILYFYNWRLYYTDSVHQTPVFAHLWSLSVEEQFYLLWPLLLLLLLRLGLGRRLILALCFGAALSFIFGRAVVPLRSEYHWLISLLSMRYDGLLWGVCIALSIEGRALLPSRGVRLVGAAVVAVAVALLAVHARMPAVPHPISPLYNIRVGYSVVEVCSTALVAVTVFCAPMVWRIGLEYAPLRWLGRISYGLYLWHIPILTYMIYLPTVYISAQFATIPVWIRSESAILLSVGVAALSHYCFERPILRWRDRFNRKGARTPLPASPDRVPVAS
jgi:peptidoglycan/LPS O-acetylase OafA/YrhL